MSRKNGKKRRKKGGKKRNNSLKTPPKDGAIKLYSHPFNSTDGEKLRAAFIQHGKDAAALVPASLEKILNTLRKINPTVVLATLAFYGSFQSVGADEPEGKPLISDLEQHHSELLQALVLTIPEADLGFMPPTGDTIEDLIKESVTLTKSFAMSRLGNIPEGASSKDIAIPSIQERLRLHTQVVRNWGYAHQVRALSSELYGTVDEELDQKVGFKATELLTAISAMVRMLEKRAQERLELFRKVFSKPTTEEVVRSYFDSFPHLRGTPEALLDVLKNESREKVVFLIMAHSDLSLPSMTTFDATSVSESAGLDVRRVERILEKLSLSPGDLSERNPLHFFMDNPVWTKPGIKLAENFFFPAPQVALSHVHRIVRGIIDDSGLKSLYESRRSAYLENKIGNILQSAFPTARILPSVKWKIGAETFETDRIVVVDRSVLIVEAKSAALTSEALRGAPQRLKRHIADLVVDPAVQSQRLEQVIRKAQGGDTDCRKIVESLGIEVDTIDTVIRLSVTIDDFSMLATAVGDLKSVGWVPEDLSLPATLNLADLETVVDVLERPALILHYLADRARLQRDVSLLADEMDLLGLYLTTLFNIPELQGGNQSLMASGESQPIDNYYNRLEAGLPTIKPSAAVSNNVMAILDQLAERQPPGWTTISLDLLSTGNRHQQEKMWEQLEKLRRDVPRTQDVADHRCAIVITPANSDCCVVFYVFTEQRSQYRRESIEQLANETLERTGRKRISIIGLQVERWGEPYRIVALAFAPKDSSKTDSDQEKE